MFRSGLLTRRIRNDGYATNDRTVSTLNPGKTSTIAVPIMDGRELAGILSLSYFSSSMTMAEAVALYVDDLRQSAAEISRMLAALAQSAAPAAPAVPAIPEVAAAPVAKPPARKRTAVTPITAVTAVTA